MFGFVVLGRLLFFCLSVGLAVGMYVAWSKLHLQRGVLALEFSAPCRKSLPNGSSLRRYKLAMRNGMHLITELLKVCCRKKTRDTLCWHCVAYTSVRRRHSAVSEQTLPVFLRTIPSGPLNDILCELSAIAYCHVRFHLGEMHWFGLPCKSSWKVAQFPPATKLVRRKKLCCSCHVQPRCKHIIWGIERTDVTANRWWISCLPRSWPTPRTLVYWGRWWASCIPQRRPILKHLYELPTKYDDWKSTTERILRVPWVP